MSGERGVAHRLSQGPCYLKLLVNNSVAGSIIGRNGSNLESIQKQTQCAIKVFSQNIHFPGTQERVVVLGGEQDQLIDALNIILSKVEEFQSSQASSYQNGGQPAVEPLMCAKLVLPRPVAAALIGKGGQQIRHLQAESRASIQVSNRDDVYAERIVTITGSPESVRTASEGIAVSIQNDVILKEFILFNYNTKAAGQVSPSYNSAPLAHPLASGQYMPQFNSGVPSAHTSYMMPAMSGNLPAGTGAPGGAPGSTQMMMQGQGPAGRFNPDIFTHPCEIFIQIPDENVGWIIGKGGIFLSEIMSSSGARVKISQKGELIPGTNDRRCSISGAVSAAHNAHVMLLQRLEQARLNSQKTNYHGNVEEGDENFRMGGGYEFNSGFE